MRSDPPEVFLASNGDVLSRLIALKVVAQSNPEALSNADLESIRSALLEERWGDAVGEWISASGLPIDAYPDEEVWTEALLDEEAASFEIRMAPIFNEKK